jgi:hypothetical protein
VWWILFVIINVRHFFIKIVFLKSTPISYFRRIAQGLLHVLLTLFQKLYTFSTKCTCNLRMIISIKSPGKIIFVIETPCVFFHIDAELLNQFEPPTVV